MSKKYKILLFYLPMLCIFSMVYYCASNTIERNDLVNLLNKTYLNQSVLANAPGNYLFSHQIETVKFPAQFNTENFSHFLTYYPHEERVSHAENRYEIKEISYEEGRRRAVVLVDLYKLIKFRSGESEKWFKQLRLVVEKQYNQLSINEVSLI